MKLVLQIRLTPPIGEFTHLYAGRLKDCGRTSPNSRCSNAKPALLVGPFDLTSPLLVSEHNKTSCGASFSSGVSYLRKLCKDVWR